MDVATPHAADCYINSAVQDLGLSLTFGELDKIALEVERNLSEPVNLGDTILEYVNAMIDAFVEIKEQA